MSSLGVYISVPFCKAKCTFCNFASDAFGSGRMQSYTDRLCQEIAAARERAGRLGAALPDSVDSIYFGGGTPSLLDAEHMQAIFERLRDEFRVAEEAEITLECAPGQLSDGTLEELLRQGMNRISFGVQSFVDAEAAAVGRLHTRTMCLAEVKRVRASGVTDINLDLIAGLPLQTEASWQYSIAEAIAAESAHVSVYMLEVDEESRLGREALAQGGRYHAGELPSEDETAEWYQIACDLLGAAGVNQYEISNFARADHKSRHNLKYWRRQPYIGFGLDAHSMLLTETGAVRLANTDDLDAYLVPPSISGPFAIRSSQPEPDVIEREAAFEEALFLGLRLNEGVLFSELQQKHGEVLISNTMPALKELQQAGLLDFDDVRVTLTGRGRLLSNEVFSRLLLPTLA
ncbi:radical SAM family heme chaperone HemW [Granulicella arctica]|uniref:Heme chaperone HemW n=1 Tax=Granulicella arctica TaxID=940613 RepID=A0A7Y9THZ8_9BACT|nr:radical SAM family heme chaperone HemW [Granulicella arctica]NYF80455.1 oxygen-independent coproporphyrinogen-3 oxidase [Granulicella arctica]